jgi:hypothetical protein
VVRGRRHSADYGVCEISTCETSEIGWDGNRCWLQIVGIGQEHPKSPEITETALMSVATIGQAPSCVLRRPQIVSSEDFEVAENSGFGRVAAIFQLACGFEEGRAVLVRGAYTPGIHLGRAIDSFGFSAKVADEKKLAISRHARRGGAPSA